MKWMKKLVVLVALLGLATGCGGDKKEDEKKDEAKKEKKAEPKKDEAAKDEPAKDEAAKDEPAKDEAAKDEPAKDEPAKDEPAKDELAAVEVAKDEPAKDEAAKDEAAKDEPAKAKPVDDGAGSGLTAEATVTTIVGYTLAGNVQGVWGLLPPSYRADLSGIVKTVTSEMDREVFEAIVTVLDRVLVAVEKNKDKLVQQIAAFAGPEAPAKDITMAVDGILDAWKGIKAAGYDKYDNFAAFDLDKFMNEQGSDVARGLLDMAKASGNAEIVEFFKLDKAKLKITFGDETEEGELVKVEGYWIPEDMAKDWDEVKGAVADTKKSMAELTKSKMEIIATLKQIEPVLAQFEANGDLMAVMGAMGGGMGGPPAGDQMGGPPAGDQDDGGAHRFGKKKSQMAPPTGEGKEPVGEPVPGPEHPAHQAAPETAPAAEKTPEAPADAPAATEAAPTN